MASTGLPPYRLQDIELAPIAQERPFTGDHALETDPVPYPVFRLLVTVLCRRAHKTADTNLDGGIDSTKALDRLGISGLALQLVKQSTWGHSIEHVESCCPDQCIASSNSPKDVETGLRSPSGAEEDHQNRPLSKRSPESDTTALRVSALLIFVASIILAIIWFATSRYNWSQYNYNRHSWSRYNCGRTARHVLASIVLAATSTIGVLGGIAALLPWGCMRKGTGRVICVLFSLPALLCGIAMSVALSEYACGGVLFAGTETS